jgi:hypothetical protein
MLVARGNKTKPSLCQAANNYNKSRMKIDPIKQYVSLRRQLVDEKRRIETRLLDINAALNESAPASAIPPAARVMKGKAKPGALSVKQAVVQVTSKRAMTKEEILGEVRKLGVVIRSDDPFNYLNTILYGKNPRFRREDGKFSLRPGASSAATAPPATAQRSKKKRFSAQTLARMSAAAKARWSKRKSLAKSSQQRS